MLLFHILSKAIVEKSTCYCLRGLIVAEVVVMVVYERDSDASCFPWQSPHRPSAICEFHLFLPCLLPYRDRRRQSFSTHHVLTHCRHIFSELEDLLSVPRGEATYVHSKPCGD